MRKRSDIWVKLAQRGCDMEAKAEIGDKTYTEISAPKIDRSLMSSPLSVGNCISSTLRLSILTDDVLDAKVPIVIKGRLTDGLSVSEWLQFGTFFINQKSSYKGLWTVSCYDAMLKTNQSYLSADDSTGWPKAMADVVSEIAYRIGVSVDPRTVINTGDEYMVPCPTGLTMMQVLSYIGGCHGGNWIITEENALRLVPLVNAPRRNISEVPIVITSQPVDFYGKIYSKANFSVAAVGDNLSYRWQRLDVNGVEWYDPLTGEQYDPETGEWYDPGTGGWVDLIIVNRDTLTFSIIDRDIGRAFRCIITDAAGNTVISNPAVLRLAGTEGEETAQPESAIPITHYIVDDAGQPIVTPEGYYLVWTDDGTVDPVTGAVNTQAVLGSLDRGTDITISGVVMSDGAEGAFAAGATEGVGVIRVESNPYATQAICTNLYRLFAGYVYSPYTATKAIYDPAAELGDQVVIGDVVSSVLYTAKLNMDIRYVADISAPNSEELSAEYPYLTGYKKLAQTTSALNLSIQATASALQGKVESNSTDVAALAKDLASEIARASGVERELNERIGAEETRAEQAEQVLDGKIGTEEDRAKQAEAALQLAINLLKSGTIADLQSTVSDQAAIIADLSARLAVLEGNTDPEPDPEPGADTGTE